MKSLGVFPVNEDGTIEIPTSILEELGIDPSLPVLMEVEGDTIKIHKKKPLSSKKRKEL
jgi:bifunctional DNA-binding transcriptional regulator/antitoxin component of YhaV-PrlF toxin-antitoxin module